MTLSQKKEELDASQDMEPVSGTTEVDIPLDTLWSCFEHPDRWPLWNKCFFWARNRQLKVDSRLIWVFQPIKWWYPYKMPAIAKIVELVPQQKVTWEVSALPGFYALHTYHMESAGVGRSRFGSWEKAMGWNFRLMKRFWIAHFEFVRDESLQGALRLESVYRSIGELSAEAIQEHAV